MMLSELEKSVYRFVRRYILRNGYAPSEIEISQQCHDCGSRRRVRKVIQALVSAEYLTLTPNKRRNIQLALDKALLPELPIIYRIPAGQPFEPLESDKVLNLSDLLLGPNRYVLQVLGNSMSGDNICHGDYILCQQVDQAEDEDIVVAQINGKETTLKRLRNNEDGTISLISSNPEVEPLVYPKEAVEVQGVYLGLIRLIHNPQSEESKSTTHEQTPQEITTN